MVVQTNFLPLRKAGMLGRVVGRYIDGKPHEVDGYSLCMSIVHYIWYILHHSLDVAPTVHC